MAAPTLPIPPNSSAAAGARTRSSLRALGSCLSSSRKRQYSYGGCPPPATSPPSPPERDDLSPPDQLGPRLHAALAGSRPAAAPLGPSAAGCHGRSSECTAAGSSRPAPPSGPELSGPDGVGRSASCGAAPGPDFALPQRNDLGGGTAAGAPTAVAVEWGSGRGKGKCLSGAIPRVCALRRALMPRSDAAARVAAARVAAAEPPPGLLTADGRLTAPPFVPCDVRTDTVDLEAVCRALAANAAPSAAAAGGTCPDSLPLPLPGAPGWRAVGGSPRPAAARAQVQGVEVRGPRSRGPECGCGEVIIRRGMTR